MECESGSRHVFAPKQERCLCGETVRSSLNKAVTSIFDDHIAIEGVPHQPRPIYFSGAFNLEWDRGES